MEQRFSEIAYGVLAGGRSLRMGRDKACLLLNGKTFLERVLEAGAAFPERLVSLCADGIVPPLPADVAVVRDEHPDAGPLEGIRQLLRHTAKPACLVVATDLPGLTPALTAALASRYPGSGNLVLTCGGKREPLCSIYARECLPVIEELQTQGLARPAFLFERVPTQYLALETLGFSAQAIQNINCPEDYRALGGTEAWEKL